MFKTGDMAVYPSQGVARIESIEAKEFGGDTQKFYVLRILDSEMTIMVPVTNVDHVGLRTLISKDKISSVYDILAAKKEGGKIASWSKRQREYNEKIKSGDLLEVAEVLRELYLIKEDKELSYGEKKYLELARRLLVQEIALAKGSQEDKISQEVEELFH